MDRTIELIKRAKEGDQNARNQVASENLGLVWSVVRRFSGRGYDLEDLYQIGCIGLLKCIDKFELSYDVKFSTYAVPMIMGEIKRFLRDDGMVKVSRSLKETAYKVYVTRERMVNEMGMEPTLEELASCLEIDKEDIVVAMEASSEVESIYKTIYQNDGNSIYLIDKLVSVEDESQKAVNQLALEELMSDLDEKEKTIITMRYFEDKTQTEIAKIVGISQVQVSRIEKKVLLKMREQINHGKTCQDV
ncbi:MAG: RNA polymerase sporulation sigma factor SigF [Lachnospiraceae bacterium]|nr:RNA polymerase sporulation sigma factor SigF [Lachnospiraceae bacterium]MBP3507394.1 RNA polymerase sporulation sigma factor SigF [Lachnospiraceae bacterium]